MNYEDLTKRIERAKAWLPRPSIEKGFKNGYLAALNDVRNDCNAGGKEHARSSD